MADNRGEPYRTAWLDRVSRADREAWNALALPLATPFLEWDWLNALESSGSITALTGWEPRHLVVHAGGRLVGAAALYIKTHSAGEFVFDHPWAEVAGGMGVRYYPKLVGMVPVTPVPGYRFLLAPDVDPLRVTRLMLHEILELCRDRGLSGCSFLFVDPEWGSLMTQMGFSGWVHQCFAWNNRGCRSFEDYLARFNANQRRNIRREIRALAGQGIELESFAGDDIPGDVFAHMYPLYERTNDKFGPWSCKYLNPRFFGHIHDVFRHRLVLMAAFRQGIHERPAGLSMLVAKKDLLFGRYWGSYDAVDHLHFNACYYKPIQWAIENGVRRFDPGLGGPHKVRRGFTAVANYSLHRFTDPRMQMILKNNIPRINRLEHEHIARINRQMPFAQARR